MQDVLEFKQCRSIVVEANVLTQSGKWALAVIADN